jgi:hypothetical protein
VENVPQSSRNRPTKASPLEHGPGGAAAPRSLTRTVACAVLVAIGIAWMAVYLNVATSGGTLGWMADLGRWNFLIGFGLVFLGLAGAANPSTPLGRGQGVVVGMLGCFLIGLAWIVVYYVFGQSGSVPLLRDLGQYNLVVGIGFMAVGFVYATHWE